MILPQEVFPIGVMRRPHGNKGEIQCQTDNTYWDDSAADFLILEIDGILVPFRVLDWRGKGADSLLFQLTGVDTEEKALRLIGCKTYMLRRDIAEESESGLTWQDLVGYTIIDDTQGNLGVVVYVDESTANTLLENEEGRLFPIHEDLIRDIDTANRILSVSLPEGI